MLCTLFLAFAPAALAPTPAAVAAGLSPAPQDDKAQEFYHKFMTAARVHDNNEMDALLRRYKEPAISLFVEKADSRVLAGSKELDEFVYNMTEAWTRAFHSDFARNYDRYLQRLDRQRRNVRQRCLQELMPVVNKAHLEAIESHDPAVWKVVQRDVESFVKLMDETNDYYFLAFAYNIQGNAWNPAYTEEGGDARKALDAYEGFLAAREKIELTNDRSYTEVKNTARSLRADLGIADPETGVVEERTVSPFELVPVAGEGWVEVELEAGQIDKIGEIVHPSDLEDEHRITWQLAGIAGIDSEIPLPMMDPPVMLKRVDRNGFVLSAGGEPSEEFKLTPKPVAVSYQRKHEDGSVTAHALMLATGLDRDSFVGVDLNLMPTPEQATVFFRSIATRTGKTPWGEVTVYDLDSDGRFGYGEAKLAGAVGLPGETFLHRFDAITLGRAKHSVPFSRWFQDAKGGWYELQAGDYLKGESIKLRPVTGNFGEVKVAAKGYKGVKLVSLVFTSDTKEIRGITVDLMAQKKIAVPAGRYKFVQGLLQGAKGDEALIFPPQQAWTLEVEPGGSYTVELGGPFELEASVRMEGSNVVVDGRSVHVVGKAGERYLRLVNQPLFGAEVSVKGAKGVEMPGATTERINADWTAGFYPQDAVVEVKGTERPPVRVTFRKHPWFGDLDTGWIE